MSKLRLNGTSSGYVEIQAAATAANNTITLPSTTGSIIVQSTTGITSFANAPVVIGSGTSTGTANQTLQVTGGAYVSGNLGVGLTNPDSEFKLDVAGKARFTDYGSNSVIELGRGQTTNAYAYIDFVGDTTYTDYGLRIIRDNTGANALSRLAHRGTGELSLLTSEAAPITFYTSNSERARIDVSGNFGIGGASAGQKFFVYQTSNSRTAAFHADSASYPELIVFSQANRSASTAFHYFFAFNASTADTEFRVDGAGTVFGDNNYVTGADYAEMFEWADGNPNNEDRVGYTVSLVGNKIKIAEEGENIIGVVSGNPSVLGDTAWNKWSQKYLRDDFNRYIYEEHNVIEWTNEDGKEHSYEDWNLPNDIVVPENALIKTHDDNGVRFTHRKLNPEYNPDQEYISREQRPEWDAVGMMGKLRVRKGQLIKSTWVKMQDISATVEEWLVR